MPEEQNGTQAPQQAIQQPPQQHVSAPSVHSTEPVQTQPQAQGKVLEVKFEDDLIMTVSADTVNDMRFLELYEQVATSNFFIPKLLKFLFGEDKYESIHDYYHAKGQKFTITKMEQVFEKLDHDLNSNPDFLSR